MITSAARCRWSVVVGALATVLASAPAAEQSRTPGAVTITAGFPGGNVTELRKEGGTVQLAPDLRGDNPWFYWYFEATAVRPGRVRFVFPEKVAGFVNGAIGYQGPAISTDGGKTWNWMGTATVEGNVFSYDFSNQGSPSVFAVACPSPRRLVR